MITNFKGHAKTLNSYFVRSVALVMALVIAFACTAFAAANESYTVDIYDGSQVSRVETSKTDAKEIVAEAEICISENDKLILDEFVPGIQSKIVICRESNIRLTNEKNVTEEFRFAGKVGEFLASQGITLGENLTSNVSADAVCRDGMEIVLTASCSVTVNADGESITVNSMAANVADFLSEAGIELGENDEVDPSLDTALSDGMTVNVLRVEYVTREENETVAFTKKTEYSSSMSKGTSRVTQKGVNGKKSVVYKDKLVNGEVAETNVDSEKEILAPIPQIITVGTYSGGNNKVIRNSAPISELKMPSKYTLGSNGVPTNYKYTIKGKAAAYCIPGGTTSTGKKVKPGYIAVNPKQIPYGTQMYIVSDDGVVYGYAIAADTGGFAKQGKFVVDLYMNSTSQCYAWGSRNVTIYVLG